MPKVEEPIIETITVGGVVVAGKDIPPEPLEEGKVALILDGKQVVFAKDQMDLPGMPEASRLRKLADLFIQDDLAKTAATERQDKTKQDIMIELRDEGRTGFALRENGVTYVFNVSAPQEKLEVKKQ
jgi:hypothetical protein